MDSFILGMTKLMPTEFLVDLASDSIRKWKANPSEENRKSMAATFYACVVNLTPTKKDGIEGAMELSKAYEEHDKWMKLNPNKKEGQS